MNKKWHCWLDDPATHPRDEPSYVVHQAMHGAWDAETAALEFAEYAHGNCDMWEAEPTWSVWIQLQESGGTAWLRPVTGGEVVEYTIEVETIPSFNATRKEPSSAGAAG